MRQSLLLFFLFSAFSSTAQISKLQISASSNVTIIPSIDYTLQGIPVSGTGPINWIPVGKIRESYQSKVGGALSFQADYKIASRFFITSGLGMNYYRYQRTYSIISSSQYQDISWSPDMRVYSGVGLGSYYGNIRTEHGLDATALSQSRDAGNTSLLYLQAPVIAGTSFFDDKLKVRAGASFNLLLASSEVESYYDFRTGTVQDRKVHETTNFESFTTSGVVNVSYAITEYFAVSAEGMKAFSSLYSKQNSAKSAKLGAISLGMRYTLRQ